MITKILKIVFCAFVYFIGGKLGNMLAVPPGFSSAIWPAAGLAVVLSLVWGEISLIGILIGAFVVNGYAIFNFQFTNFSNLVAIFAAPLQISLGAMFAAFLASFLAQKYAHFPETLEKERFILKFFILTGPVASIASSSIGVSALYFSGVVNDGALLGNWYTWWAGDTLGVIIFAPLVFIFNMNARVRMFSYFMNVVVPLFVTFMFAMFFYFYIKNFISSGQESRNFSLWTVQLSGVLFSGLLGIFLVLIEGRRAQMRIALLNKTLELEKNDKSFRETKRFSELGKIAGGFAHEVGNPLAVITLVSARLKRSIDENDIDAEVFSKSLSRISHMCERITKIIHGLNLASGEASVGEEKNYFYFSEVIQELQFIFQEKLDEHKIKLIIENEQAVRIYGHFIQFSEVIFHLVSNSVEALSQTQNPLIKIQTFKFKDHIEIHVCDNGPGVSEHLADKIFDPFFTTKDKISGGGLGLSISRGVIEKHDGRLYLKKEHPPTTFVIELPNYKLK